MANELIVASLSVTFGEDSTSIGGSLKLEIDDRPEGGNDGETSFKPGDDVVYFLFKDSNVEILEHFVTAGGISPATAKAGNTKVIDDFVAFTNSSTASLDYPPSSGVTRSWMGKCYTIAKDGTVTSNATLPDVEYSELSMPNNKNVAGILRCKYTTTGDLYKVSGVAKDVTEIMIMAIGRQVVEES